MIYIIHEEVDLQLQISKSVYTSPRRHGWLSLRKEIMQGEQWGEIEREENNNKQNYYNTIPSLCQSRVSFVVNQMA